MINAPTFDEIARLVRATQARPDDEVVRPEQLLFYDLAFTSMDLLDLLFRIEDGLGVSVAEGTILRLARGDLSEVEFASEGVLTPRGRERLMALLHDTPPEVFPSRIGVASLPRYCTVAAIARLVEQLLAEKAACSS